MGLAIASHSHYAADPTETDLNRGALMYLCICHALTENEVRRAARQREAASAAQYFRGRGLRPRCGHCAGVIHAHMTDEAGDGTLMTEHAPPSERRD